MGLTEKIVNFKSQSVRSFLNVNRIVAITLHSISYIFFSVHCVNVLTIFFFIFFLLLLFNVFFILWFQKMTWEISISLTENSCSEEVNTFFLGFLRKFAL